MKIIKVPIESTVNLKAGVPTELLRTLPISEQASENRRKVLEGGLSVEHALADRIADHFFEAGGGKRDEFEVAILNTDWCSFGAKVKLYEWIIRRRDLLSGKQLSDFVDDLRKVMKYRNAFAHGSFEVDESTVILRYFQSEPRADGLTDEYLEKIEKLIFETWQKLMSPPLFVRPATSLAQGSSALDGTVTDESQIPSAGLAPGQDSDGSPKRPRTD